MNNLLNPPPPPPKVNVLTKTGRQDRDKKDTSVSFSRYWPTLHFINCLLLAFSPPASFVYLSSMLVSVIWSPQDESHTQNFPVQLKMVSMHSEVSPVLPFKTVPMFIWSMTTLFRPFKEDCLALPLSTPLSCRQLMVWCRHFPVPLPNASDQITSQNAGPRSWTQHSLDNQSKQLITLTSVSQYLHFSDFTHTFTSWGQLVS